MLIDVNRLFCMIDTTCLLFRKQDSESELTLQHLFHFHFEM